ncbi:MAG: hypothetical protein Q7R39_20900, partial [Dehalococcoidia bacterium]|nr:hypothetical protein [Dehalococcoidia bacterium]
MQMSKGNPARTTSIVWWILTPVFLLLTFFSFTAEIGDAAFAFAFVSFIMFLTAIIVAVIYGSRARGLDRLLAGEGLLAHWTYQPDEWLRYTETEYQTEKGYKKTLLVIISGFALTFGVLAVIADRESGILVLAVMLALIMITSFTAWFTSWHDHRRNLKYQGGAYISKGGVYLNKQLHLWNQTLAYLGSVEYVEETTPLLA